MLGPTLQFLNLCVSTLLGFAASHQDGAPAPTPLQAALSSARIGVRVGALRAMDAGPSETLLPALASALRDGESTVRRAAYDALGRTQTPAAFDVLADHYRARRRELLRDDAELASFLIGLARLRDERAVALLAADVAAQSGPRSLRARLLGLGRIRTRQSVEALVSVMDALPFAEQQQHLQDFRVAMIVLTGTDQGLTVDAWRRWWLSQPPSFTPPPEVARLAGPEGERWRMFWRGALR